MPKELLWRVGILLRTPLLSICYSVNTRRAEYAKQMTDSQLSQSLQWLWRRETRRIGRQTIRQTQHMQSKFHQLSPYLRECPFFGIKTKLSGKKEPVFGHPPTSPWFIDLARAPDVAPFNEDHIHLLAN